jgi:hypothetical protein
MAVKTHYVQKGESTEYLTLSVVILCQPFPD